MEIEIVDLEDLANAPSRRYGHTSTLFGRLLFVFGGSETPSSQSTTQALQFHTTIHRFNLDSMCWDAESHEDTVSGVGRHFHTCVLNPSDECLYIFGGKSNGYRNDLVRFDPKTNLFEIVTPAVMTDLPSPRWGHSAVIRPTPTPLESETVADVSMLVFGGYDSNGFVHNTLHEYVFSTRQWTRLTSIDGLRDVPRRYLHSGVLHKQSAQYVIVRGLMKNKQALDDVWALDLTSASNIPSIRQVEIEVADEDESLTEEIVGKTYGQRVFEIDEKLYLYGGRETGDVHGGDDIQQCLQLNLVFEEDDRIRGVLSRVEFPFPGSPSAYGTVNAIQVENEEEEEEGEMEIKIVVPGEEEEVKKKIFKLLFFGGQGSTRPLITGTRADFPKVFPSKAANLLHFCPDEVLYIVLEFLDRVTLCSIRAVSSRWSPGLLSPHDRLWKPIYAAEDAKARHKYCRGRSAIELENTFKGKCQAVIRADMEEDERLERQREQWAEESRRRDEEMRRREAKRMNMESFGYLGGLSESDVRGCWSELDVGLVNFKCVVLGDGAVGKTCMLISYANNHFPDDYVPTVFDNYNATVLYGTFSASKIDSYRMKKTGTFLSDCGIQLEKKIVCVPFFPYFFDSNTSTDDRLRPLSYPETDVFLMCFSLVDPTSFENVRCKWVPEVRDHRPTAGIVLIGTKLDLREDPQIMRELQERDEKPVTRADGERMARELRLQGYFENSAKTQKGLKETFHYAITLSVLSCAPKRYRLGDRRKKCGLM